MNASRFIHHRVTDKLRSLFYAKHNTAAEFFMQLQIEIVRFKREASWPLVGGDIVYLKQGVL